MVIASSADSGEGPYEDMESFGREARELMKTQGGIGINSHEAFDLATYGALAATPLNRGGYTLKERWSFQDNTDGEVLELLPGDELLASRSTR